MTMKNDAKLEEKLTCQFKRTWGIWGILTQALENVNSLHFNGLLSNKVYIVWAKKSIGELCLIARNVDATFGGELTCAFKNDMRTLLLTKVYNVWAKKSIEELCLIALKIDGKIERKLTCNF